MKSKTKQITELRGQVIGMGFLLKCIRQRHGHDFSEGMADQVRQAVRDYELLARRIAQSEADKAAQAATPPSAPQ